MDAFILATGLDEENLLLALIAKQVKVEDVISRSAAKASGTSLSRWASIWC